MNRRRSDGGERARLIEVIHGVRRRWRLKLALRGVAALVLTLLAGLLLGSAALRLAGASPAVVVGVRAAVALVAVGVVAWLLFVPLARRVTDEQVALYLEEHEPSLRASLLSALSAADARDPDASPALARRTIETALERCREVEYGRRIERPSLRRSSGVLGGVGFAGLLLFLAGPGFVRTDARTLLLPMRPPLPPPAMSVAVEPGDTSIAKGADLAVSASLVGFRSDRVDLLVRPEGDSTFQRLAMLKRSDGPGWQVRLFDLSKPMEYQVVAGSVRSPLHRVEVLDLPYVDRLELELLYPAYTGLPSRHVEDGGDVAAPAGTLVRLRALPTRRVAAGRLVLTGVGTVPLAPDSAGALRGEFRVQRSGLYHVELTPERGRPVSGSPQYLIEVLDDRPPTVSLSKPGRDTKVTAVDEVYVEARAEDDFGVKSLELVYSVNGAPEKTIPLLDGRPLQEAVAGHTLYLEEMGLHPGDFVSYYARAADVGPTARPPVTSDIFFLEIRPYGRDYKQADAAAGGGGMQGGNQRGQNGEDEQLSRRQRELIAATFNVARDRERTTAEEFAGNVAVLAQGQEKLRQQAETLARRLANRGAMADSAARVILESLPRAAAEMEGAVAQLQSQHPSEALPAEQRALVHLLRAEAAYREVQVSIGQQQQGGGGGGGQNASAEDLADLFGLELDKLRNQYETVQRGEQQQAQGEVESALDRVKELARRQEQVNEQLRSAMAERLRNGSAADEQRRLADETEEQARQLERLSHEQSRPDLMDAARRLRDAADAMRRAAAGSRNGDASDSRGALDRLRDASRRLEGGRASGTRQQVQDAAARARRLAEEQRDIQREMGGLAGTNQSPEREARARRLEDRKDRQAEEVSDLERQLDRLAAASRGEQPDASRRLQAAAESMRRNQIQENIRASRAGTQPGAPQEYVRQLESQIAQGLEEAGRRVQEAQEAMGSDAGPRSASLDRARELARGLESLQERTRQAQDDTTGGPGRPGSRQAQAQQGREQQQSGEEPGQSGQQGQRGRGQSDRSGQQGGGAQSQQGGRQGQAGGSADGARDGDPQQGEPRDGQPGRAGTPDGGGRLGGLGPRGGGAAGWGERGPIDYEEARQLRRESQERLAEARELRRQLAAEGRDVRELDRAIADLTRLAGQDVYADWEQLQRLQSSAADLVKQVEFTLRRQAGEEEARRLFLSGSSDVPPEYRELVERYYRELSEGRR